MGDMRVRVRVSALRERVEAAALTAEEEFAREESGFSKAQEGYAKAVIVALREALEQAMRGHFPEPNSYQQSLLVPIKVKAPSAPSDRDARAIRADLALLDLAADDVLTIGHQDRFARYLR